MKEKDGQVPKGTLEQASHTKSKRTKRLIIGGCILLALTLAFFILQFCTRDTWYAGDAQIGSYEGKTAEEIQADLNRRVEEGMMNISMSSVITFANGTSQGEARIENIEANQKDQKVTITLIDTDEVVYESDALAPGQYIQYITLNKNLPAGTYEAVAMFDGYELETHKKIGSAGVKVKLVVQA